MLFDLLTFHLIFSFADRLEIVPVTHSKKKVTLSAVKLYQSRID